MLLETSSIAGHSRGNCISRLCGDGPGMGSSSAGDRIPMWLHPAGQAPAAHIPHPSQGAQSSARGSALTAPLLLTVADPFPGTEVPSSHEAELLLGLMDNDLAPAVSWGSFCPGEREVSSELFCVPTQQRCLPPLDSPGQTPSTAATGRNTLPRTCWG
uniref:Uncharacterized protein n=1 Tax=Zosterops lateralis melanops TaxID=1220523 RepID=A0A8D2PD77_ZOSLA